MDDSESEQGGLFNSGELPSKSKPADGAPEPAPNAIRLVPVSSIRLWSGNPRSARPFDAGRDAALADNIAKRGQKVSCIVRPIEGDLLQLIAGCRRFGCVAHLAIADPALQLLVEVRAMNDEEAFILVDSENAAREDVTAFERATYQQWALTTLFEGNQARLADALGVSETTVSRSLDLVRLPAEVNAIITDLNGLTPNMVAAIGPKCNNPDTRADVVEAALAIGAGGKTYAAGKAISLIKAHLDPPVTIEPVILKQADTGDKASISAGPKESMVVKILVQDFRKRSMATFMKEVSAAMPAFAARLADAAEQQEQIESGA